MQLSFPEATQTLFQMSSETLEMLLDLRVNMASTLEAKFHEKEQAAPILSKALTLLSRKLSKSVKKMSFPVTEVETQDEVPGGLQVAMGGQT